MAKVTNKRLVVLAQDVEKILESHLNPGGPDMVKAVGDLLSALMDFAIVKDRQAKRAAVRAGSRKISARTDFLTRYDTHCWANDLRTG